MKTDEFYSVEGAAAWLGGVSKWTVHAWLGQGKLKKTKIGSRTMIRESDLQAFVAECNRESDEPRLPAVPPVPTERKRPPAASPHKKRKSAPEMGPERVA